MTDTQPLFPATEAIALQPPGVHALTPDEAVLEVVARWHNDAHDGAFRFCQQQPCGGVQTAHTSATVDDTEPVDDKAIGAALDVAKTELEKAMEHLDKVLDLLDVEDEEPIDDEKVDAALDRAKTELENAIERIDEVFDLIDY